MEACASLIEDILGSLEERIPTVAPAEKKWTDVKRDITKGDVILLKDKNLERNRWSTGLVLKTFESSDGHVRKAEVKVMVNGKPTVYTRPIVDMILLLESNCI
jgi:hypothetical protein